VAVRKREYRNRRGQQVWDYDFWHDGIRYRKAGFLTKAEAEIAEANAKRQVYNGGTRIVPSKFEDAVDEFLRYRGNRRAASTVDRDRRRLGILCRRFGQKRISMIASADIDRYVDDRVAQGKSPQTINHEVNLLSCFFKFAISRKYAHVNPAKCVERLDLDRDDDEEFDSLVAAALKTETGLQLACWLMLRGYTGCRPGESFQLRWRDCDFGQDLLTFRHDKKGNCTIKEKRSKTVPIHDELKPWLARWREEWERRFPHGNRPHDWVFFHPRKPWQRAKGFRKTFERAKRLAGLDGRKFSYHTVRHYFITRAVESGMNFLVIARLVGHSSTKMVEQVYAKLQNDFKAAELAKFRRKSRPDLHPPTPRKTDKRG